ncbi:hypothetical protein, partial [Mesorhizobium sp.]|uniref:hypothetical protein n=1 Tax=Mesorhizobium sp. TaxID=1871066 RepID=UPI0025B95C5C
IERPQAPIIATLSRDWGGHWAAPSSRLSHAVLFFVRKQPICLPLIFRPIDPGLAIIAFADVYLQNLDAHRLDLGPVNLKQM